MSNHQQSRLAASKQARRAGSYCRTKDSTGKIITAPEAT